MTSKLLALSLLATLLPACDSGFVDGWRGDEQHAMTPDECEAHPGLSWIGGKCQRNAEINLTEVEPDECERIEDHGWFDGACQAYEALSQQNCAQVPTWAWVEGEGCRPREVAQCEADRSKVWANGRCLDRPTLALKGELEQTVTAGFAITPVAVAVSPGAVAEIVATNCPGYFDIKGTSIVSKDSTVIPAGVKVCTLDVVASSPLLGKSQPQRVSVKIEPGFLTFCQDQHLGASAAATVRVIKRKVDKADCVDALVELVKTDTLDLEQTGISDLTPLKSLIWMKHLDLSGNKIVDLSPLSGMVKLESLDVSANTGVRDISPVAKLPKLDDGADLEIIGTALAEELDAGRRPDRARCPYGAEFNGAVNDHCAP